MAKVAISLRIDRHLLKKVDALAKIAKRSRNNWIEAVLAWHVEDVEKKED